ncbi:MAG: radical SAM protein [Magnetococcales bacterium]|nr:radical SAM protein [Magnetococcales bacterium]
MNWLPPMRFAQALVRANLGGAAPPYKLTFALTNRCNARCQVCRIWQKPPGQELSLGEIERLIRKNNRFSWIDLTGGEPFLRPDLMGVIAAILRHARGLYHLHLPTNGVAPALIIARIGEMLRLKPHRLTITLSLDGPPELHDTLRGVAGNWAGCLTVYRHFVHHPHPRLRLFFGFTLSDRNVGTLAATMEAVRSLFPDSDHRLWHLNLAHHSHYYGNGDLTLLSGANQAAFLQEITALRETKKGCCDPVAFLERRYLTHALDYIRTAKTPMPCLALRSSLFLAPDGECFPCSIWERPLGNVRAFDFDLGALLASERARETLEEIRAERCPHCWTPCDAYPTILGHFFTWRATNR